MHISAPDTTHPLLKSRKWYPACNSVQSRRAVTWCTVPTYYAVQFSEADIVGIGLAILDYLNWRWFTLLSVILAVSTRKRDGRKYHWSAFYTGRKPPPTTGWRSVRNPTPVVGNFEEHYILYAGRPPGHHLHGCGPILEFILHPVRLCRLIAKEATEVAASSDHPNIHIPEVRLWPRDFILWDNWDTLGRIW